jgi:hypothetical protein
MAIRLKLIISDRAYPKHICGVNPETNKSYNFVRGWAIHTDDTGVSRGHSVTMSSIRWNAMVAEGLRECDEIYVDVVGEGKADTDKNNNPRVAKASNGVEYAVMCYPVKPADYNPPAKFRGLPLPLAKDLQSGNRTEVPEAVSAEEAITAGERQHGLAE